MINTDCAHGNNVHLRQEYPNSNINLSNTSSIPDYFYQRYASTNTHYLSRVIKKLYKTDKQVTIFESGMMAINVMVEYFVKPKQRIILPNTLFCEIKNMFKLDSYLYDICYVDMHDMDKLREALTDNTALVFLDTPSNPLYEEYDVQEICDVVHFYNNDIKVAIDNTLLSAYYYNPFEYGADIVVESLGKYLDGHCDVMGGVVIYDSKENNNHYNMEILAAFRGRYISPFSCYMIERGIKTLPLRMERITETAKQVYEYLKTKTPYVKYYGKGGLITFSLNGGRNRHEYFVENVKLISQGTTFGAVTSLIQTSFSVYDQELVVPYNEHLRLSVGLEDAEDIIADLENVFNSYENNYQEWLISR